MTVDIQGPCPLLSVFDMPTALAFYRDVLGFELLSANAADEPFDWVLLRRPGAELMLNTAYEAPDRPSQPDPVRWSAHKDIGLYFGCADLDGLYAHLRAHGVDVEPPRVASYGMRQLYVKDPDGYTLCFQHPASDETREQWRQWYSANPD